jgi:hypothetical protein
MNIGEKYVTRWCKNLDPDRLIEVKITGVFELGDGTVIVVYRPKFSLTKVYIESTEFINNSCKV